MEVVWLWQDLMSPRLALNSLWSWSWPCPGIKICATISSSVTLFNFISTHKEILSLHLLYACRNQWSKCHYQQANKAVEQQQILHSCNWLMPRALHQAAHKSTSFSKNCYGHWFNICLGPNKFYFAIDKFLDLLFSKTWLIALFLKVKNIANCLYIDLWLPKMSACIIDA